MYHSDNMWFVNRNNYCTVWTIIKETYSLNKFHYTHKIYLLLHMNGPIVHVIISNLNSYKEFFNRRFVTMTSKDIIKRIKEKKNSKVFFVLFGL